jgi:hypothetical protein
MDLFALDYFHPSECRNCGGLVRNSGWNQFLGPATMMAWFLVVVLGFRFLSEWLVLTILLVTMPLPKLIFAKPVKVESPLPDGPSFAPDPNNDKTILIQGWHEDELRKILDDFVEQDLSAFAAFRIEIEKRFEELFELTFPEDVHPREFLALINYLAYPIDFDLARSIVVAGKATLNSDFDGLAKSLEGKKALFYLPENDDDYLVVYMQTESGVTLARSFSDGLWRTVKDSRLSNVVKSLAW